MWLDLNSAAHIRNMKFLLYGNELKQISNFTNHNPIWRHCGKQVNKETKLRIQNITAKAALKFGSEACVLKKREEQRLEAAQMKFLRHLLGITKLDKEKKTNVLRKKQEQRIQ